MQKIVFSLILAGLASGIAGCRTENGTKGSNELTAEPARTTAVADTPIPAQDTRPLIVCFGDSLTAGYGAEEGASYPDFLQQDLDRAGFHYRVVNEGVSGNTTKDGIDRLAGVEAMKPAVVVLEFGGNDGLRGLNVQTTRANLATMIAGLKSSGTKVALAGITLPPDYGPDYVKTFSANYPALAKRYDVPLLPFLLDHVYGVPGMMQEDRTHATAKGNEIVAKNVMGLVEPLLKR